MTTDQTSHTRERGIALVYVGVFLVPLLLCTGLAVDLGRGYLVRVALAKAVDAAALAAARNIAGDQMHAQDIAYNIFNANFPAGFLGVTDVKNPPEVHFAVDDSDGSNKITVKSNATLPTTFMRIAKFDSLTVTASAEATRRLVDMSFVIDRSGSLSGQFPQVQAAAETFVKSFDPNSDRIALITFSSGTTVKDHMSPSRMFDRDSILGHIETAMPRGPTATAEALYEAWGELRSVPSDSQSGLRIVVLFTDGSPNAFPGNFRKVATSFGTCNTLPLDSPDPAKRLQDPSGLPGTICAIDYPKVPGNSSTRNEPYSVGLYQTNDENVSSVPPTNANGGVDPLAYSSLPGETNRNNCIPYLPQFSSHTPTSNGMPSGFFIGPSLPHQRDLGLLTPPYGFENNAKNAYNAARNLAETVADAIRRDTSGPRIRIYTLGLGDLLNHPLGNPPATGSDILRRIANDSSSIDYDSSQLEGRYYFAGDPVELDAAFQAVRDQIVRLTQ